MILRVLRGLLIGALPFVVLVLGILFLARVLGANPWTKVPPVGGSLATQPLYGVEQATSYWAAFSAAGLERERLVLRLDLAFPPTYVTAFAISLFYFRRALGQRRSHRAFIVLTLGLAALSDWTENLVQLGQIELFKASPSSVQPAWIRVASVATSIKLASILALSVATVVYLLLYFGALHLHPET